MDRNNRRMAALTKAVHSAVSDDDDPPGTHLRARLPGGTTVAAFLIVLVALAGIGVWRNAISLTMRVNKPPSNQPNARPKKPQRRDPETAPGQTRPAAPASTPRPGPPNIIVYVSGAAPPPASSPCPPPPEITDAITRRRRPRRRRPDTINLARPLTDGEHIHPPESETGPHGKRRRHPACVRLDTANATDLQTLPGIGPALAERIIDYRATHPTSPPSTPSTTSLA